MPLDPQDREFLSKIARAEGRAQAKLMTQDVAEQFNLIHKADAQTINRLCDLVNKLGVMVDVLKDLLIDDRPMRAEGLPANKREKFNTLCTAKLQSFTQPPGMADKEIALPSDA